MRVLGIDEAGRGCVFGPMVVAGFVVDVDQSVLRQAGATDSKRLSHQERLEVRAALRGLGVADVRHVPPCDIDAGNLNTLEEALIVDLICTHRPDAVLLDALGPPAALPNVLARLAAACAEHALAPELTMETKADLTFPVVGAASIFAKTARDHALAELAAAFGDLGTGYPSDPKVRAWLRAWMETGAPWPAFVRTKWATVRDLAQGSLF